MAYGLEIYNESGVAVITITTRLPRFVATGTTLINAGQSKTIFITGLQNSDSWDVVVASEPTPNSSGGIPTSTVSVYSGYFVINNNSVRDGNFTYWVLRI